MYKFDFKNNFDKDIEITLDEYFEECINENQKFINKKILIHHYKIGKLLNEYLDKNELEKQLKKVSNMMVEKYDSTFTKKTLRVCMKFANLYNSVEEINYEINWPYYVFILELDNKENIYRIINKVVRENLSLYELKNEIKKIQNNK